ncbi:NADH:flavin oxidoreductase [Rhodococcus sp. B50]|uniref:NADH:flavin oxidoreductase n=1 Tax=Rhodococcus sp. B50 TaxID=2682847 RepID=UPI002467AD8E|nr:NADH:flavin oxidoreductase [Rhodococcus sp. B50]MBS9375043.1 putative oxidoreductase [Rhodococcus sp. B50]
MFDPLTFRHGRPMSNRFMLAPLTNTQSEQDGSVSDDELRWLTMRARGGFGSVHTCAAYVREDGKGFPGQMGISSDVHMKGLERLATAIKAEGALASVQLFHAGYRAPRELVANPVAPSRHAESGARAMSTGEVEEIVVAFADAAQRAERAGFDGVQLHGGHAFLLEQFLASKLNCRTDRYGGSEANRSRIYFDIIAAIRDRCSRDFQVGVRVSPDRLGIGLGENLRFYRKLIDGNAIDYLDLSLGDALREPREEGRRGRSLLSYITALDRGAVRLGAAGRISTSSRCHEVLRAGVDYLAIGLGGILHHDFPRRVHRDFAFVAVAPPVSHGYLEEEGVGPTFVEYLRGWPDLVS